MSYVGEMLNDDNGRNRRSACREFNNCGDKIALFLDGEYTHNLRFGYDLQDLFGNSESRLYFGVNNVGNNQGPVLYAEGNTVGENHHVLYDINGRYYYGGVEFQF